MTSYKNRLLELLKNEELGNNVCADCNVRLNTDANDNWASYNLGVFLCVNCAAIHRMLGAHLSKVKSIQLDQWNRDQVEFMECHGNAPSWKYYEHQVPPSYRRPREKDPQVLREQWIRAKYERLEFQDIAKQTYLTGKKSGMLFKRGKGDSKFMARFFILDEEKNSLVYYTKHDKKSPKATIPLFKLKAVFVPEKIGNPNGLQLTYKDTDNATRNIYVYSDSGKEIVEWYTAIRNANYNMIKVAYPDKTDEELQSVLHNDFTKEGFLCKTGPRGSEGYKKRWFTLDKRNLHYYNDPLDAHPIKTVAIGGKKDRFACREGLPPGILNQGFTFTMVTPDREFYLSAETETERKQWMEALQALVNNPVNPQDYDKSN